MGWLLFGLALIGLGVSCFFLWRHRQKESNMQKTLGSLDKKIEKYRRERNNLLQSLDQHKLETAQLRHAVEDALNRTDFLGQALTSIMQPFAAVNLRHKQVVANLACLRLYGYPADICNEIDNPFLQRGTPTAHLSDEAWRELNQGHLYWGTELVERNDGKNILVERRVTPILDNQGLAGYICLEEDVTRKQIENPENLDNSKTKKLQSDVDVITGFLNSAALQTRLSQQIQRAEERLREGGDAQRLAVARIDLMNMQKVVHEHGQGMTDAIMIEISQRIRNVIRAGDYAARINHEQIVVVFHRVIDKTLATELCIRLKNSIENRYEVGAFIINIEAGIQISLYPDDGRNIDALLETHQRWASI